jgi:hypothetical protein
LRATVRTSVCAVLVLAGASGAGLAEERLVMPFTCAVEGGEVVLSPAPEQSYRILGKRERRKLTACSPFEARCRRTAAFRFDLDCGGTKTSWASVVAAMVPGRPPGYGGPPPVPYGGPRWRVYIAHPYGPPMALGPFGAPRRYAMPPGPWHTNLPQGFAPVPDRLARFVTVPDDLLGPIAVGQSVPLPSRKPAAPAALAALAKTGANALPAPSGAPAVPPAPPREAASELGTGETTGAIPQASKASPRSAWTNLIGAAGLSFLALILFASVFVLSRRGSRSLQLYEDAPGRPVRGGFPFQVPRRGTPYPGFGGKPFGGAAASPPAPGRGDWLPSTLSEALEVLGASPETGADMLKAIVKSLRRTWHPDLAAHEEDRRVRERKLKQVNAAWDIVCGKRGPRRPASSPRQA